ncbi:MAG: hypothetical protein GMKNLPBB_02182 [Myxococcota bacterium]|nr:hypothetical protein [Myxococcota bacterium]
MPACWNCGTEYLVLGPVSRGESCRKCLKDIRSCRNCKWWDSNAQNQCREPHADPVQDRETANFCDWFSPGGAAAGKTDESAARAKLEMLFKK